MSARANPVHHSSFIVPPMAWLVEDRRASQVEKGEPRLTAEMKLHLQEKYEGHMISDVVACSDQST
jgi:hypothetical protein